MLTCPPKGIGARSNRPGKTIVVDTGFVPSE